jgi:hypothetical protein
MEKTEQEQRVRIERLCVSVCLHSDTIFDQRGKTKAASRLDLDFPAEHSKLDQPENLPW